MNNFSYENQGTNTYLVYKMTTDETVDAMSLGMILNNKIPNIADVIYTQVDDEKYLKYNISAKVPVSQFFSGQVNKKRLIGVFSGIVDAFLVAEDYMIDVNCILLDLDYIFVDVTTCETLLVCLPIEQSKNQVDLGNFFKQIMFNNMFDQSENCDYVAKIMNYLNSNPIFSLSDFKNLIIDIKNQGNADVNKQPTVVSTSANPVTAKSNSLNDETKQPKVEPQKVDTKPQIFVSPEKKIPINTLPQNNGSADPNSVNIPVSIPNTSSGNNVQSVSTPETNEKKMSMLNLLMHYSKENAAVYKAQKNNEKLKSDDKKKKAEPKYKPSSFVVPGAPQGNAGFAIPGQERTSIQPIPTEKDTTIPASQKIPSQITTLPRQEVQTTANSSTSVPSVNVQPVVVPNTTLQSKPMDFGNTTVLGGGIAGETTVLNSSGQNQQIIAPHLIRTKNNEKIPLTKPNFRIGKEKSYVDYFIGDNTAISRSHANIITDNGKYFIVDTNSTNHTYVDGQMIQSGNNVEITHGTKIRLANEDFEFRVY